MNLEWRGIVPEMALVKTLQGEEYFTLCKAWIGHFGKYSSEGWHERVKSSGKGSIFLWNYLSTEDSLLPERHVDDVEKDVNQLAYLDEKHIAPSYYVIIDGGAHVAFLSSIKPEPQNRSASFA
jgi:hypothetical protein